MILATKERTDSRKKPREKRPRTSKSDQGLPKPGCPADICTGYQMLKLKERYI
jgi:hypothetical protein